MPVVINAHQLGRLIDRTIDHIGTDLVPALHGIHLEADATHLYAIASDRFTLAAARYAHDGLDGVPPVRTIPAGSLPALRQWISSLPGADPVTVAVTGSGAQVRFTAPRSDLGVTADEREFFDWRGVLRAVTEQTADTTGTTKTVFPALSTRLQARFRSAGDVLRFHAAADQRAVLVAGEDFLGAQVPLRAGRDAGTDTLATLDDVRASWQHTLSGSTAVPMRDAVPAPPRSPGHGVTKDIGETAEELLKQTLRSTEQMLAASVVSDEAFAAYATAGVTAWTAYRYLDALLTADPRLAATVVAETADELDSGEIGEFAREAAAAAGHDPHQWQDESEAPPAGKQSAPRQTGDRPATEETSADVTVNCHDVHLDTGENLRDLAVGGHLELAEPTAGMHPGTWQLTAFHGATQDRATLRPLAAAVTGETAR